MARHEVAIRELFIDAASGMALGSIACRCGWLREVGPVDNLLQASAVMEEGWARHLDDPSATGRRSGVRAWLAGDRR